MGSSFIGSGQYNCITLGICNIGQNGLDIRQGCGNYNSILGGCGNLIQACGCLTIGEVPVPNCNNYSSISGGNYNMVYNQASNIATGYLNIIGDTKQGNFGTSSIYCVNTGSGIYLFGDQTSVFAVGQPMAYYNPVDQTVYAGDITSCCNK
jgi:hypothetical protein